MSWFLCSRFPKAKIKMSAGWGPGGLFGEETLPTRALLGGDLELGHERPSQFSPDVKAHIILGLTLH